MIPKVNTYKIIESFKNDKKTSKYDCESLDRFENECEKIPCSEYKGKTHNKILDQDND